MNRIPVYFITDSRESIGSVQNKVPEYRFFPTRKVKQAGVESYLEGGIGVLVHVADERVLLRGLVEGEDEGKAWDALRSSLDAIVRVGGRIIWSPSNAAIDAEPESLAGKLGRLLMSSATAIVFPGDVPLGSGLAGLPPTKIRVLNATDASGLKAVYDEVAATLPDVKASYADTLANMESVEGATGPEEPVILDWPKSSLVSSNWGDKLNPVMATLLSGRPAVHSIVLEREDPSPVYRMIGSSLGYLDARDLVYGAGFIDSKDTPRKPRAIHAVRGPLSRAKLLEHGIEAPDVYGDVALLLPLFYRPKIKPSFDLGIIQHFRELGNEPIPRVPPGVSVKVLDILSPITTLVDDILSCRGIISSSLHGVIAAHAYGVPATWVKFSDRPLGDGFKFRDYFASVGYNEIKPFRVTAGEISSAEFFAPKVVSKPLVSVPRLIQACPFISDERKGALLQRAANAYPAVPDVRFLTPPPG